MDRGFEIQKEGLLWVRLGKAQIEQILSALPSIATIARTSSIRSFVPIAEDITGKRVTNQRSSRSRAHRSRNVNWRGGPEGSLRPLPHDLQRQAGKRAGIRELHFVGGDGRNDPPLIGSPDKIWKRARLDIHVDRFCAFVHRIRARVGDRSSRGDGHSLVRGRASDVARRILWRIGARQYEVESTISVVGHRALQARPRHVAAIITLGRARNVNPRSDELILE